jgi:hypothetical protein
MRITRYVLTAILKANLIGKPNKNNPRVTNKQLTG